VIFAYPLASFLECCWRESLAVFSGVFMSVRSGYILRALNLVLAVMQIAVTIVAFEIGPSFNQATAFSAGEPPIIPAGYAFAIWTVIYAGSLIYGVFQITRNRAQDLLLQRIRPFTASAFLATVCWLIAARFNLTGLTVICMLWLLGSLLPVFMSFMTPKSRLSAVQQFAMVIPLSIYTGWVTVAVFADLSAFLYRHGILDILLTPAGWAVAFLIVAGLIAAWLTFRSASTPFALTICWALIAILVANLTREKHPTVVICCAAMTATQLLALALSKRSQAAEAPAGF